MLLAQEVDVIGGLTKGRTTKLRFKRELPFTEPVTDYSALQAYFLNVQAALCDRFDISPKKAADVMINAADEIFAKWHDITTVPNTLLATFARVDKQRKIHGSRKFTHWTVRVCSEDEMREIAVRDKWDYAWNINLHEEFNVMLDRALLHDIPLPPVDAPIEEWMRPARNG
jgi:hypothetical protein